MSSFFELNLKSKIGFKRLSEAELQRTDGHQSHIGLFEDTVEFVTDDHKTLPAKLIYENNSQELLCFFDVITRASGDKEAPKIRAGEEKDLQVNGKITNSVVREIWKIASKKSTGQTWFLLWFGLSNGEFVFYLIEKDSREYNELCGLIPSFANKRSGKVDPFSSDSKEILKYLEIKTSDSSIEYLKSLEIIAQTEEIPIEFISPTIVAPSVIKLRRIDIEKARARNSLNGKKGEELINDYLSNLKSKHIIKDFEWENKSKESGFPYDFKITDASSQDVYMDVKTTSYFFEQDMIFSSGEISFINKIANYHVYRVFNLYNENGPSLRVCEDVKGLSNNLLKKITTFKEDLETIDTKIKELKLQISPINSLLKFKGEILLS